MNINVKFFEDNFVKAIGAGIYEIYLQTNGKIELLYIGESVFVLVRCATHLYEIKKGNGYFGFNKDTLENSELTLVFKFFKEETDRAKRKTEEKALIKKKNPKMQSGISDRVKSIEEMIDEMVNILK